MGKLTKCLVLRSITLVILLIFFLHVRQILSLYQKILMSILWLALLQSVCGHNSQAVACFSEGVQLKLKMLQVWL